MSFRLPSLSPQVAAAALLMAALTGCTGSEDTPEVLVQRGNLLREEGRFEEAGEVYRDAVKGFRGYLEEEPENAYVWYELAELYFYLGEAPQAIEAYQKAMEFSSEYAESPLVWYRLGTLHSELGNTNETLEAFNTSLRYDPSDAEVYNDRGWFYQDVLRDNTAALRDYNEATRLDPAFVFPIYNRAILYASMGENELALADISRAIELEPEDPFKFVLRGEIRHDLGQFEAAIEDYSHAIELDSEHAAAYHGRGLALRELGRSDDAEADLERAYELDRSLMIPPVIADSQSMPDPVDQWQSIVSDYLDQQGYADLRPGGGDMNFPLVGERDGGAAAIFIAVAIDGRVRLSDVDLAAIRTANVPVDLVVVSPAETSWEVTSLIPNWSPVDADLRPIQFEVALP